MRLFLPTSLSVCLLILILCGSSLAQAPALVTAPVDNSVRTVLPNNVHPLARPQYDQGEVPEATVLHRMLLILKRSDQQEAALRHLIENQQNKKSSLYHQWVTPEQFGQQFGLADSDLSAVVAWLQASGFAVTEISNGRTVIEFDGTAGLVKKAFGTALHYYLINGTEHIANSSDPSIPTALAPVIAHVNSLHDFFSKAQNVYVGKYDAKQKQLTSRAPNFTVVSGGTTYYAVAPYDFATIYDELPLWTATPTPINGSGVTIAIVGRTDIDPSDAPTFWSLFGLDGVHAPQPTLQIITNGPDPGFTGDEGEADIDTQWSGAAAPGATIDFVTSATTETTDGVDLSAFYIVDNNLAPVVSESYGICEAAGSGAFYGAVWEQAAAQGISAMVSAGDNGSAGCDDPDSESVAIYGRNVSALASTPWNAAVGGTDFNQPSPEDLSTYWNSTNSPITQQSVKSYIPELVWNDSCANPLLQLLQGGSTNALTNCNNSSFSDFLDIVAGSGGASGSGLGAGLGWLKPAWQTGTGVPSDNARDLPDVSLFASNGFLGSFYVICQSDQTGGVCNLNALLGYGGTSVASPAFAGIMALVNQKYGQQGVPGFHLYNLASNQATENSFHDLNIVSGTSNSPSTNAVPCQPGSTTDCNSNSGQKVGVLSGYSTNAGYDLASGLGSVDVNNLVTDWDNVTFTPTNTTLTLNNGNPITNVTHGSSVPVAVTVAPQTGPGTPTGDVAILVAPGTPGNPGIDGFTLSSGSVSSSTNLLPGGTYQVIAHYGGDTTFGGSYSAASSSITINPETSSVSMPGVVTGLDANGNPVYTNSVTYGTGGFVLWENKCGFQNSCTFGYWLRADVFNKAGNSCQNTTGLACPTGTINFTDNGQPLDGGTFKLNSFGYTQDQGIQLTGGSHTLAANYSGDASYLAVSTSTAITVTPATTTINNVAVSPSSVINGGQFTATATVSTSSYGVAPTGAVAFFANGNPLSGTVQLTPANGSTSALTTASLAASLTSFSLTASNTYSITATYTTGDGNYSSQSTSNSAQLVVSQGVVPTNPSTPAAANPGQTTSLTVSLVTTDNNPFANNVTLSCTGLPSGATCSSSSTSQSSQWAVQGLSSPQTVTLYIATVGPFSGSAGQAVPANRPVIRRRAMNQRQQLWLPMSLPLAGVLLVGLTGRKLKRAYKIAGISLMLILAAFLVACGGSSSPPPVVTVSPTSASLWPSLSGAPAQTQQFTASVTNTSNTAVTWTASAGTIDSSGLFTAPATVPTGAIAIAATSQANSSSSGTASVSIKTPTPAGTNPVTLSTAQGSGPSQSTTFNLTVN